ncbi:DNA polymerase III subunit gamma and tau [Occultella gossypii]|uniref:DNA-directed DNA polymerase n=1 Tax=Occultella gossypii TaxID=2800820 RepID=A0ABS7SC97_9MICO|nr:DNA polymerase III subunit gamma and tau [Occultella gossypii]MBZ2197365.1 DNA polymerase III subunit gamma and tau [Occultella gossypii]
MSTALYRRYRPETFADVIGQEHVTEPLMAALRANRVTHAYLFSGPRGCGKTTSARILARCLNCAQGPTDTPCGTCDSCVELARGGPGSLDVVEIDAASHNGVDDARELRERAAFAPARDRYKIFILDEAHMVTTQGFNALLKLVEEPPAHVKFIFATTEPDKVIGTIRSRTHHYPFRLVPPEQLTAYLERLATAENMTVASGVLPLVVRAGGGSVRDSLSVLDQLIAGADEGEVTYERAVALLGFTHGALLDDAIDALSARDGASLFRVVERVIDSGHAPRRFVEDLLERMRDLIVVLAAGEQAGTVLRAVPEDQLTRMAVQAQHLGLGTLSRAADLVNLALTEMIGATSPRLQLELLCARLLLPAADDGVDGFNARLDRLEGALSGVAPLAPRGPAVAPSPAPTPAALQPQAPAAAYAPAADQAPAPAQPPAPVQTSAPSAQVTPPQPSPAAGAAVDVADGDQASAAAARASAEPTDQGESAGATDGDAAPQEPASDAAASEAAGSGGDSSGRAGSGGDGSARAAATGGDGSERAAAPGSASAQSVSGSAAPRPDAPDRLAAAEAPAAPPAAATPRPTATPPAAAPAAAAASAGSAGMTAEQVRRRWPEVLETLTRIKRTTWALISQDAQVVDLNATNLALGFSTPGLASAFRNGSHGEHLQRALSETLGLSVRIDAVVADGSAPAGQSDAQPGDAGHDPAGAGAPAGDQTPGNDAVSRAEADWGRPAAPASPAAPATPIAPANPAPPATPIAPANPAEPSPGASQGPASAGPASPSHGSATQGSSNLSAQPSAQSQPSAGPATQAAAGRAPAGPPGAGDSESDDPERPARAATASLAGAAGTGGSAADDDFPPPPWDIPGDDAGTSAGESDGSRDANDGRGTDEDPPSGGTRRESGPGDRPTPSAGGAPRTAPDDDIPPAEPPDFDDGPPPEPFRGVRSSAPRSPAPGPAAPTGGGVPGSARDAAFAAARAAQTNGAGPRGGDRTPSGPAASIDEPDMSDPDIESSGLIGAPLVARLLGGTVIDEITETTDGQP